MNETTAESLRRADAEVEKIRARAAAVNAGPDFGAAHLDHDGNLQYTLYGRGDKRWKEYPDGRIEWC